MRASLVHRAFTPIGADAVPVAKTILKNTVILVTAAEGSGPVGHLTVMPGLRRSTESQMCGDR